MKLRAGLALLGVVLFAGGAEAGWFGSNRLPRPVSPILHGKLRLSQRPVPRWQHRGRYDRHGWGSIAKQALRLPPVRQGHYMNTR
jgi:hypothetical protein